MYGGLAVSVLAACLVMLGKRRLNRHDRIDMHGTFIQRSRHRHRKMDRMVVWHFDITMETLPVMPQITPLLSCYILSRYLWNIKPSRWSSSSLRRPDSSSILVSSLRPRLRTSARIKPPYRLSFGCSFITTSARTGIKDVLASSSRPGCGIGFWSSAGFASARLDVEHLDRYGTHRCRFAIHIPDHLAQRRRLPSICILYESILSCFDFTKKPSVLIQSFNGRALAATKAPSLPV